jgi:transcription initiation factor TFIIIB Brf1 subunit/transcription initiation factor TFIIB
MGNLSYLSDEKLNGAATTRCIECGGSLRIFGHELVCSSCGLVNRSLDYAELGQGNEESEYPHLLGHPPGLISGLGSEIRLYGGQRDGKRRQISPSAEALCLRLGNAAAGLRLRTRSSEARNIKLMWQVSKSLGVPQPVAEAAVLLYRRSAGKFDRGHVRHAALAACCLIYIMRNLPGPTPSSVNQVLKAFSDRGARLRTRDILRAGFVIESKRPIRRSEDYLYPILDRVTSLIDERTLQKCGSSDRFQLLQRLLSLSRVFLADLGPEVRKGRNPFLVASAVIYASAKLLCPSSPKSPISQRVIAQASGAIEYSVRETYEGLRQFLHAPPEPI